MSGWALDGARSAADLDGPLQEIRHVIAETQDGRILAPTMPAIVTLRPLVTAVSALIAPMLAPNITGRGITRHRRRAPTVARCRSGRRALLAAAPAPLTFSAAPRLATMLGPTIFCAAMLVALGPPRTPPVLAPAFLSRRHVGLVRARLLTMTRRAVLGPVAAGIPADRRDLGLLGP